MRVLSGSAQRSPVAKWCMLSPVTPGMFAVRLCCLVRSNHSPELTHRDGKTVCYFVILSALFSISNLSPHDSMITLQMQFSNKSRSQQLSLFFHNFQTLISTAPKDRLYCKSLSDVAHFQRSLKCDILEVSCTCVFDMFVEFISVFTCVKCVTLKDVLSVYPNAKQL